MKRYTIILLFTIVLFSSCNDWLDVTPKSEVREREMFSTEEGFNNILTGVYIDMAGTGMYGGNLTMGLMDVLARYYPASYDQEHPLYYAFSYEYTEEKMRNSIDGIWKSMYSSVANCNIILDEIDSKKGIFTGVNFYSIKAQALIQRAFLHFDILRMFAPSPLMDSEAPGIPYVSNLQSEAFPQLKVADVIKNIKMDIQSAEDLLNNVDEADLKSIYFNIHSARALKARVCLYAGEKDEAFQAAKMLIDSDKYKLIDPDAPVWGSEFIMDVYSNKMFEQASYFYKGEYKLNIDSDVLDILYEGNDLRGTSWVGFDQGTDKEIIKYKDAKSVPLLKLSEMYLIAAECAPTLDEQAAYLSTLRQHRALLPLSEMEKADIQKAIFSEYIKEFLGEGQLWFYYKRMNSETIETTYTNMFGWPMPDTYFVDDKEATYIFPIPVNEMDFGKISREWLINNSNN